MSRTETAAAVLVHFDVSDRYLSEATEKGDALAYWEKRQVVYPQLAVLAKRYLCVLATSAPVERLFSTAGKVFGPE